MQIVLGARHRERSADGSSLFGIELFEMGNGHGPGIVQEFFGLFATPP
jgi:hypothetical protein